ncbi:nucleotidyltransferase family protein [Persicitalea sp.]|uniref:nucleotidyltransferase family protein n=1 Tax=Persicitalea sp. TaxID=3100273 RepID=UPI0035946853
MTNFQSILQTLTYLKPELVSKYHIRSLGLFGSVVRDDFTESSDVDILVDFSQPIGIEFIDLADFIEDKLHKKVDLVSRNGIKEKYFQAIESELVYV